MAVPLLNAPATRIGTSAIISLASWYSNQLNDAVVVENPFDATQWRLYISGQTSAALSTSRVGLFTMPKSDPFTLTLVGQTVTPSGTSSAWDEIGVRNGSIYIDPVTKVHYYYYTGFNATSYGSIGLATSADGVTFTPQGQILTPTGQGRNDGDFVSEPRVVPYNGQFVMTYSYRNGATIMPGFRVATASAPDGTWTKYGVGDVLSAPSAGLYCEWKQPFRIANDRWGMLFDAGNTSVMYKIYAATASSPLGPWTVLPRNILIGEQTGAWDQYAVCCAGIPEFNGDIVLSNGKIPMYYTGSGNNNNPADYVNFVWPFGVAYLELASAFGGQAGLKRFTAGAGFKQADYAA